MPSESANVDRIVIASEKVADAVAHPTATEPLRNFSILVSLIATVLGVGCSTATSYIVSRMTTEFRVANLETKQIYNSNKIEDMEKNGHVEHEKRIAALETTRPDRTLYQVLEQGKQIAIIAQAVHEDHDSIVRILTIYERDLHARSDKP